MPPFATRLLGGGANAYGTLGERYINRFYAKIQLLVAI